jgi:hypothetical protein
MVAALVAGVAPLFGFTAIALGLVGYVTALFKLSAVLTILWAKLFLSLHYPIYVGEIRFIPVDVTFSIPSTRMRRLFPRSQIEEPNPDLLPRYIDKMPLHRAPDRLPRTALDYVRRDAIRR